MHFRTDAHNARPGAANGILWFFGSNRFFLSRFNRSHFGSSVRSSRFRSGGGYKRWRIAGPASVCLSVSGPVGQQRTQRQKEHQLLFHRCQFR